MAPERRSHDDYKVGWICALPKEQTAATAMLDERHPDLSKPTNDTNTYTLGSIGSHNVVIACLPKGQYGTNSAANVATLMIRSFPSIKIGLMVGIGGGVPMKVRLGDVVVSTPGGQFPGVVQWDLGKATEGGKFERTGALSNPPSSLLTALAKLETEHELAESKIPGFLEELREKYPRLAKKYLKSDSLQDMLFRADYAHVHEPFMNTQGPTEGIVEPSQEEDEGYEEEYEESCPFCDQNMLLERKRRSMRVHHGLIASGNKVIKDGLYRDKLNNDLGGDVLCFEMEAAGLMSNFPCLVIRGICDYCDSHKNKAWQEHAAAVAAAFAKELLGCIPPSDVKNERLIKDALSEEAEMRQDEKEAKRQEKTLNWLTSLDFHQMQHDYFRRCQTNTGQEFINSEEVQSWISTNKQTLFSQGIAGAGKTFQMAILVNYLVEKFRDDGTVGVAYLYYSFKRHGVQKPEQMLASLVKQLAQSSRLFPEAVHQLHDQHVPTKTHPFLGKLSHTLVALVKSFSRVFILIDALDEGDDGDRTTFLHEMFAIQEKTKLNLFATSRPICNIQDEFNGSISKDISPTQNDIYQFLDARMSRLPKFVRDDITLQSEVKAAVESAIGGMFLLAQLYIDSLAGKRARDSLEMALKDLHRASSSSSDKSSVLDQAYDKSMERIQQLPGDLPIDGLLILSWIVKAKRQLKLTELQEAIAVENGASDLNTNNIPTVEHIIESCASLVIIEGDIVKLVHYTAQEYFERPNNKWMENAHEKLTKICMTYLSFSIFRDKACFSPEDLDGRIENNPLYSYSAEHWAYHTNEALHQGLEVSEVVEFLGSGQTQESWYRDLLYGHSQKNLCPESIPAKLQPLHVAAFFGIYDVASKLLEQGHSPNAEDSLLRMPIWWAAWSGNDRIVQLLLERTAIVDTRDEKYGSTPLLIAAMRGYETVVGLLLDKYDIESKDSSGWTSLSLAAQLGNKAVFDLLITKGADVEANDKNCRTPLAIAAIGGRMNAVKWLLEEGADIEAKDSKNRTPLMLATIGKHEHLVRYFIEKGADLDEMDDDDETPLSMAIREKLKGIIELLIEIGDRVNTNMENKYTPLTLAIKEGNDDITKWLIEKGASLDNRDGHKMTPLLTAIEKGNKDTIELLIKTGAGLEVKGRSSGDTPLILATEKGRQDIVELLIYKGASLEASNDQAAETVLTIASQFGHTDILKLFIEKGAKIEAKNEHGDTPLNKAAKSNKPEAVRLLLANNANMETKNDDGGTPLIGAARHGYREVIQLLLANKANIEAKDNRGLTPLSAAIDLFGSSAIPLFLTNNAFIEAKDNEGRTPLMIAVRWEQLKDIQLLLDNNADLEAKNDLGFTPLAWAIREGYHPSAELLLKSKANTNYRDASGQTLMHIAVDTRNLDSVNILLSFEAVSVDELDNNGRTPLSYATERGDEDIVKALLESGKIGANMKDKQGRAMLLQTIDHNHVSTVTTMLDSGTFDVNAKDDKGRTPLFYAIYLGDVFIVGALLDSEKTDVNAKDDKGRTPLRYTVERKNVSIMKVLLDCEKVDVDAKDNKGRTPLLYAIELNDLPTVQELLDSGKVDLNARDDRRRTPLRYAIEHKNESIIGALLDSGKAYINAKDIEGYTPLLYAIKLGEHSIVQLLLGMAKINANTRDRTGRTPLSRAMGLGNTAVVNALLYFDEVDVEARDKKGRTPLSYAASCNVARVLLRTRRVDVNSKDILGRTPLWYAAQAGNHPLIELLVRRGAYDGSRARNMRRWAENGVRHAATSSGGLSLWQKIRASRVLTVLPSFVFNFLSWSSLS